MNYKVVKELPTSWEEYIDSVPKRVQEFCISSIISLERVSYKYVALYKLTRLRDEYRKWWKPRVGIEDGYCVIISHIIDVDWFDCNIYVFSLSFPTRELRDQFQENFKSLIEQAKPLYYS
jgi:hypothetical protein